MIMKKSTSIALGAKVLTNPNQKVSFMNLHVRFEKVLKPVYEARIQRERTFLGLIGKLVDDCQDEDNKKKPEVIFMFRI